MKTAFNFGKFDLDIQLRDEALSEMNSPTRRMIANATIGIDVLDAYYSVRELHETVQGVFDGTPGEKARLARILSTQCDDYQRCIYYCLAGRGIIQMLEDLEWLEEIVRVRTCTSSDLRIAKKPKIPLINPYVSAAPDGPLVDANPDFQEGPSWYLDPDLGGELME